jgi:hypothetical protein
LMQFSITSATTHCEPHKLNYIAEQLMKNKNFPSFSSRLGERVKENGCCS